MANDKTVALLTQGTELLKEMNHQVTVANSTYKQLFSAVLGGMHDVRKETEGYAEMQKNLIPIYEHIEKLTWLRIGASQQLNKEQQEYLAKQMKGQKQVAVFNKETKRYETKNLNQITERYETQKHLLQQDVKLKKEALEDEIELRKAQGLDLADVERFKGEQLKAIDEQLKKDLAAADKDFLTTKYLLYDASGKLLYNASNKLHGEEKKMLKERKKAEESIYTEEANRIKAELEGMHMYKSEAYKSLVELQNKVDQEHAASIKKITAEIDAIDAAASNKRIIRLEEYAAKMKKLTETTKTARESVSGILSGVSDQFKEDIEGYAEKEAKAAAVLEKQKALETKIAAEKKALGEATTEEAKNQISARIELMEKESKSQEEIVADNERKQKKYASRKKRAEARQKVVDTIKAKAELAQAMVVATGDIAAGAAKAFKMGPIIGPIMAALVIAQGGVQLSVMARQMTKFEDGGLLSGKRHRDGGMRIEGTNIEVEGGEYVVNRDTTRKNLGLMSYINSQRKELSPNDLNAYFQGGAQAYEAAFSHSFENGGELPAIQNNVTVDNEAMVDAIRNLKFEPRVAVTDIIRAQDELTSVDGWAGM